MEGCSFRSTASTQRSSSAWRDASLDSVDSIVLTASGGPFRGRTREQLADVTRADALAHPTWNMGPKITIDSATLANKGLELIEAHFLFGLPYEQIEVVVHPTSVVHAIVRFRDGASLAHLGYPDMRVPISYALTYPERAATPVDGLDFANGLTLEFEAPDVETFPMLALARKAGESGGTHPCAYNAANEVAVAAFLAGRLPFLGIAGVVEDTLAAVGGAPGGRPRRAHRGRRRSASPRRAGGRSAGAVNIFIAIIGLSLLVLVHEAGHFFSARAVGMSPRRFYIGFPPALAKVKRKGIEYGIGAVPLGGYVKIPGMHRPAPSDLSTFFGPALEEAPQLVAPIDRIKRKLDEGDMEGARGQLPALAEALQHVDLSRMARRSAEKGLNELADGLGADAYWRQRTWKKVLVIFAGPGTNLLFAVILFATLFVIGSGGYRLGFSMETGNPPIVHDVRADHPAAKIGLRPGDRILRINGAAGSGRVRGAGSDPAVARRPDHARRPPQGRRRGDTSSGRSGHARSRKLSVPQATWQSVKLTGVITKEIGASLSRLVRGNRKEVSSPVGIVEGSSEALSQGLADVPLGARPAQPVARAAQPAPVPAARRRPHRVLADRGHPRARGRA